VTTYVVHLTFKNDTDRLRVRPAHRAHLQALHERGALLTAGPWADDSGAMHVYRVADEQ
jgi:uncharacterized protein